MLVGSFVDWFVGDRLLLRDFGLYGIIVINVRVAISVVMVMLLRDFGPYGFCLYVGDHLLVRYFEPYAITTYL
jgi:hypothetical protein